MAQIPDSVDPKFVESLKAEISGIYFTQVAEYTPQQIADQFRKIVLDPALVADDLVMRNLLFLVRKRDVQELREDVARLIASNKLKALAQVSGLKTLYALGGDNERNTVDYLVSQALAQLIQSGNPPESSPYVAASDGIGGQRSLVALRQMLSDATARQRSAEQREPDNHAAISQLDKTRASLEGRAFTLSRKLEIMAQPEPGRSAGLIRAYLRRSADLSCWAYRELVDHPSADSAGTVRAVLATELPTFLPAANLSPQDRASRLLDLRLRGVALLQSMRTALTPEEQQLLQEHAAMMQARVAFFYPGCDWEEVLDRV